MASVSVAPSSGLVDASGINIGVDRLPDEMNEMKISDDKVSNAITSDIYLVIRIRNYMSFY